MKRSYISHIVLLFMALAIPTACSDDNEDAGVLFDGSDAFITSFQLEKEGDLYEGVISGTTITLSVPTAVSLASGVTAAITVSENAILSPDPSTITNWEHNEQFIVRAYNGIITTYTYSVQREVNTATGTIRLETQQEVEQFIAKEIQILEGTLIIGKESLQEDETGVTDISGLATLQHITYDLVINPGYTGNDLAALNNLQWAGSITINDLPDVKEIEWTNLQTVVYDFSVSGSKIESVNFPGLASVGGMLTLNTGNLVKAGFNYLQQVGGILLPGGVDHPLETVSFPFLKTTQGDITVQNYPVLTTLDFPALVSAGDIEINALISLNILEFPNLKEMGSFKYTFGIDIESIRFPLLESMQNLYLSNSINTQSPLLEIIDFSSLKIIRGDFLAQVYNYPLWKDIYFPLLEEIGGNLSINNGSQNDNQNVESIRMPVLKNVRSIDIITNIGTFQGGNKSLSILDFTVLSTATKVNITNQTALNSFKTFRTLINAGILSDQAWSISGCAYNPTYQQMLAGGYSEE